MKSVNTYSAVIHPLRNGEHYDFHDYVSAAVRPALDLIPEIKPAWGLVASLFGKEDLIYKRSSASVETKFIVEAGQLRFDIYMMFHRTVDAASYSYDAASKEAAATLREVLDNYKAIASATMSETSALIVNMVEDMAKPRYADAAKALNLTAVVGKLDEANDNFRNLYIERANSLEYSGTMGTMKDIRAQVDKAFRLFTQALDVAYAYGALSGDKDVTEAGRLIDRINAIIDQFKRVLSHRGHSTAKKDGGDDGLDHGTPADADDDIPPALGQAPAAAGIQ
ncbi:MAG: DUF6261 family protein [Tannerellaceae bacterium]|jgi:hypothetical protein|nr:DUF6261 family protein [Tannerellaceae bacterium]